MCIRDRCGWADCETPAPATPLRWQSLPVPDARQHRFGFRGSLWLEFVESFPHWAQYRRGGEPGWSQKLESLFNGTSSRSFTHSLLRSFSQSKRFMFFFRFCDFAFRLRAEWHWWFLLLQRLISSVREVYLLKEIYFWRRGITKTEKALSLKNKYLITEIHF